MGFRGSEWVWFLNWMVVLGVGVGVGGQQMYAGNSQFDCEDNSTDITLGYRCNGEQRNCQAYALYRAQFGYHSVSFIGFLLNSDTSQMADINAVAVDQILGIGHQIIAPISCSCTGNYSQSNATYAFKQGDYYYKIGNTTFEGLTTCRSLIHQNAYAPLNLPAREGKAITIPLRCACPTREQARNGIKYLLSYPVASGDDIPAISRRFNTSVHDILDANRLLEGQTLYPFTTILVPLTEKLTSFPSPPKGNKSSHAGLAIGIGVGIAAFVLLVVAMAASCIFMRRGCSLKRPRDQSARCHEAPGGAIRKVENFLKDYAAEMPTRYSYSEVKRMTNHFSHKLGEGGFGVVYRGMLSNGTPVAAKLLDQSRHSETQFMNEVATIGRIHHVNLVRLLGFCFEGSRAALLYEYMPNGSLDKFIFPGKSPANHTLNWQLVHSIALGVARGIAYLHTDCERRIIHLDIKPHNVLLDENFTPKVSDFGLARLSGKGDDHISVTAARGTPGYAAPEIWFRNWGNVTDKSDVYSFGMLLLEIVGGRRNMDPALEPSSSQFYFPEWIFHQLQNGKVGLLREMTEIEDQERSIRMIKVGLWCIQQKSDDRPSMSRVVQMLEGIGGDVGNPPFPFDDSTAPRPPLVFFDSTTDGYSSPKQIPATSPPQGYSLYSKIHGSAHPKNGSTNTTEKSE